MSAGTDNLMTVPDLAPVPTIASWAKYIAVA
jgi:hypothetical protein